MHVQFRVAGGQERDARADRDGCGDRSGHPSVNDTTILYAVLVVVAP